MNSPHKGQRRGALMLSLICAWINGWVNNHEAGDLIRHCAHYDVTVMAWPPCTDQKHPVYHANTNDMNIMFLSGFREILTIVCDYQIFDKSNLVCEQGTLQQIKIKFAKWCNILHVSQSELSYTNGPYYARISYQSRFAQVYSLQDMDTIYPLLVLCAGNSPTTSGFPAQ